MPGSARELWTHAGLLQALARQRCQNAADADDLVQETFVRALRAWHAYDDRGSLRGWLVTILHRLSVDRRRRAHRAPRFLDIDTLELPIPQPDPTPAWALIPIERVHAALAQVPPVLRRTFELRADGRSYDEIADELRIPKRTVGTRLLRSRRRIRHLLEEELTA